MGRKQVLVLQLSYFRLRHHVKMWASRSTPFAALVRTVRVRTVLRTHAHRRASSAWFLGQWFPGSVFFLASIIARIVRNSMIDGSIRSSRNIVVGNIVLAHTLKESSE